MKKVSRSVSRCFAISIAGAVVASSSGCQVKGLDVQKGRVLKKDEDCKKLSEMAAQNQEILVKPLKLEDVIEHTLNRNLDLLVQDQEFAIKKEAATGEKLRMLPRFDLTTNHSWKNIGPQDRGRVNAYNPKVSRDFKVHFEWDLLNFGLSYFQARRGENQQQLAFQRNMRLRQTLVQKATAAYWYAVVAQKAAEGSESLIEEASKSQEDWMRQVKNKNISEVDALENQKQLTQMKLRLKTFQREYRVRKNELAALMGLLPGTDFQLQGEETFLLDFPEVNVKELEEKALLNRPELYAQDLEEAVSADKAREAIVEMFPHLKLSDVYTYDKNPNYKNQHWNQIGLSAAYNLLSIPHRISAHKHSKLDVERVKKMRLSQVLAILTQVHKAYYEYQEAGEHYKLSQEVAEISSRRMEAAKKLKEHGEETETKFFKKKIDAFLDKVNAQVNFADAKVAIEDLNYMIGIPFYIGNILSNDSRYEEMKKMAFAYQEVEKREKKILEQQKKKRARKLTPMKALDQEENKKVLEAQAQWKIFEKKWKREKQNIRQKEESEIRELREAGKRKLRDENREKQKINSLPKREREKKLEEWEKKRKEVNREEKRAIHQIREARKRADLKLAREYAKEYKEVQAKISDAKHEHKLREKELKQLSKTKN